MEGSLQVAPLPTTHEVWPGYFVIRPSDLNRPATLPTLPTVAKERPARPRPKKQKQSSKPRRRGGIPSVIELCRFLESESFVRLKPRGKEPIKFVDANGGYIVVPAHRGDIKNGTLAKIRRRFRETTGREMPW